MDQAGASLPGIFAESSGLSTTDQIVPPLQGLENIGCLLRGGAVLKGQKLGARNWELGEKHSEDDDDDEDENSPKKFAH